MLGKAVNSHFAWTTGDSGHCHFSCRASLHYCGSYWRELQFPLAWKASQSFQWWLPYQGFCSLRYFHVPELKHLGSVLKINGSSYVLKSRHPWSWISSYDPLILEKYGKDSDLLSWSYMVLLDLQCSASFDCYLPHTSIQSLVCFTLTWFMTKKIKPWCRWYDDFVVHK